MRTFGLNSAEFYDAITPAPEPHVWAGRLPQEPRGPRPAEGVKVSAEDDEMAGGAVREWLVHLGAGRIEG